MHSKHMKLRSIFVIIIFLATIPGTLFAATLYVVVSDNLRGHPLSSADAKRIFLGEISMLNNQRINLIYPSYSSPEIEKLSQFVGKGGSVRNLKSYWSKMIFTGKGNPPLTANSEGELKQLLSTPNSIGVSSSNEGMNVVYTIG